MKSAKTRTGKKAPAAPKAARRSAAKAPASDAAAGAERGGLDQYHRTTVLLLDQQAFYLDRLAAQIRMVSGGKFTRSGITRALIEALQRSGIDVTSVADEAELTRLLAH